LRVRGVPASLDTLVTIVDRTNVTSTVVHTVPVRDPHASVTKDGKEVDVINESVMSDVVNMEDVQMEHACVIQGGMESIVPSMGVLTLVRDRREETA